MKLQVASVLHERLSAPVCTLPYQTHVHQPHDPTLTHKAMDVEIDAPGRQAGIHRQRCLVRFSSVSLLVLTPRQGKGPRSADELQLLPDCVQVNLSKQ